MVCRSFDLPLLDAVRFRFLPFARYAQRVRTVLIYLCEYIQHLRSVLAVSPAGGAGVDYAPFPRLAEPQPGKS